MWNRTNLVLEVILSTLIGQIRQVGPFDCFVVEDLAQTQLVLSIGFLGYLMMVWLGIGFRFAINGFS